MTIEEFCAYLDSQRCHYTRDGGLISAGGDPDHARELREEQEALFWEDFAETVQEVFGGAS